MKLKTKLTTLTAVTLVAAGLPLSAESVESSLDSTFAQLEEAVPGKFSINTRVRYEIFDLASTPPNDRDGTSLRVRYGYKTPDFGGFTAMVEGDTLTRIGGNSNDIHPLDDAGDGTDLSQAWVQFQDADYGSVKVGRQIYALDDHRFIGHVGWRQNIQNFDAATANFTGIDKLSVKSFFFDAQNSVTEANIKHDTYGFNVSYAFDKSFKLTGFFYEIDSEDVINQSNKTFGLRANGTIMIDEIPFVYAGSFAEQEDSGSSALAYDASYIAGDLSTKVKGFTFGGGFEIMEAGFRTPLSTVHKFNGFADALLPLNGFTNGLEDFYVYAGYTLPIGNGITTKVIYHWFDTESDNTPALDGGTEIDLVASYKFNKYFSVLAKYGDYDSDGGVGVGGLGGAVGGLAGALDKKMFTFELNFIY